MLTMKTRASGHASGLPVEPQLPPPAPLPGLVGAFSRRRAIFGAVVVAAAPAAILRAEAADIGMPMTADARLAAIADELCAIDEACNAHAAAYRGRETGETDAEFEALVGRFDPLEEELAGLPADTLAGVLAKVRVLDIPTCRDVESGIADSVCADLRRLHAAGRLA